MRSDDELIKEYLKGKVTAFEELYHRYSSKLRSFLITEVGITWAEDLLQETFSRLLANLHRYRPNGKFSAYLYKIAKNLARDRQRTIYRDVPLEDIETQATTVCHIDHHLERTLLLNALKSLTAEQKKVILLREYLGLSFKEISQRIKRPLGTVLSHMHRAVGRLKHNLVLE